LQGLVFEPRAIEVAALQEERKKQRKMGENAAKGRGKGKVENKTEISTCGQPSKANKWLIKTRCIKKRSHLSNGTLPCLFWGSLQSTCHMKSNHGILTAKCGALQGVHPPMCMQMQNLPNASTIAVLCRWSLDRGAR
jgi:hypothetical protein